ncbi:hypothetical protein [Paucibacter sp. Y2R2-4]|uniref:hypothetical protein n=1 Tax=Paucibacter sp. Y2R2-4 TaxID=2893553 RepID=UPI0021E4D35F|nr:hypothetical protein [Paucibacter sp. Y2R2-4]MCV2351633.1 hypothetical protein [Paucibacter sp. Y2R2-4]
MRLVLIGRWTLGLGLALLLALAACLALSLQRAPLVAMAAELAPADVQQAKDFARRNDPRKLEGGEQRILNISEKDLNLLIGQAARVYGRGALQMKLSPGLAQVQASLAVPQLSVWLNVQADLAEGQGLPSFKRLQVGHLPLPAWLANRALRHGLEVLPASFELQLPVDMVEHIGFSAELMHVRYRWQKDSMARVLSSLWPAGEQQRAQAYQDHLARWVQTLPAGQAVSLATLMPPMFTLAQQRSAGQGTQAAAENRAAVLTLALYAVGESWARVMPAAQNWIRPMPLQVTLNGRDDFALHFLVSAALALEGGGPLADAIGVYKELSDSRGGSGFSFNDIAADRAGTRFGLFAETAPERLQALMSQGQPEAAFMPNVADLPEFLSEREFLKRYGGVDGPAYRQMMRDIESRLDALSLRP